MKRVVLLGILALLLAGCQQQMIAAYAANMGTDVLTTTATPEGALLESGLHAVKCGEDFAVEVVGVDGKEWEAVHCDGWLVVGTDGTQVRLTGDNVKVYYRTLLVF